MYQVDLFSGLYSSLKFDPLKPLKLFEAFSGYGSQYMALKRLGVNINHKGMSDWWITANIVFHALHNKNTISYDFIQDKNTLINILMKYGLSSDDKTPVKRNYYERKQIEWLNELHKILIENKNPGAIGSFDRLPKGIDVCTWSFPCQDISLAGNQKGMNDGTKSNYGYIFLDTVENTPKEERPKVLLMENVRALFSKKFRDDWREIQLRLERMGYTNYADVLNAKDYGVAQRRERVFIVSILGEYNYTFPKPIKRSKRLKDYLEDDVDEKYYLSAKTIENTFLNYKGNHKKGGFKRDKIFIDNVNRKDISQTVTTKMDRAESQYVTFPFEATIIDLKSSIGYQAKPNNEIAPTLYASEHYGIVIPEATKQGYALAQDGDGVYINRPHQKRGVVQKGMIQTIKTSVDDIGVVTNNYFILKNSSIKEVIKTFDNGHQLVVLENGIGAINTEQGLIFIRKLTPRESLRLMDVSESDIDIITSTVSNAQAYKLAGNSIVVNVLVEIFKNLF